MTRVRKSEKLSMSIMTWKPLSFDLQRMTVDKSEEETQARHTQAMCTRRQRGDPGQYDEGHVFGPVARLHEVEQHQGEARDREHRCWRDGAQAHGGEHERVRHLSRPAFFFFKQKTAYEMPK